MKRIKQCFAWWCFSNVQPEELVFAAANIGYQGVELAGVEHWPLIKKVGLTIVSIQGHASIEDGLNRRENCRRIQNELAANIETAVKWGIPNLICFSGNRDGIDDNTGAEITAESLHSVAKMAENAGVTLALELLNSKVDHKGYQCDKSDWGIRVCQMVASPNVKLLYDIYHMQIMEGNIIQTIHDNYRYIAHYHTAGVPGRRDLDDTQELNYPAILREIQATGYEGFIGQEFIPKGDPIAALKKAFELCDV